MDAEQVLGVGLGDLAEEEAWGLEEGEVGHGVFSRWGQSEPGGVRIGKLCSQRPSGTPAKRPGTSNLRSDPRGVQQMGPVRAGRRAHRQAVQPEAEWHPGQNGLGLQI
jgi:hypothetical protein